VGRTVAGDSVEADKLVQGEGVVQECPCCRAGGGVVGAVLEIDDIAFGLGHSDISDIKRLGHRFAQLGRRQVRRQLCFCGLVELHEVGVSVNQQDSA